jgi:PPOX class probable F420-dependent enzyme
MTRKTVPSEYMDLFGKRAFAHLATMMPDGKPQVTPVWVDYDGEYILINSAQGRQKVRNVKKDPNVSMAIMDPDNVFRYLGIRGKVVEITRSGAPEHIDKLARKYTDADGYKGWKPGMVRLILKIEPIHFYTNG